jgi:uncharacterized membrane protein
MQQFLVLAFKNQEGATQCMQSLAEKGAELQGAIQDAAIVIRLVDGSPRLSLAEKLVERGKFGGIFWGIIIGLIFWTKWWGLNIGSAIGGIGLDDDFIREVGGSIERGSSGLFMIVHKDFLDRIQNSLTSFNPQIFAADLDDETVDRLAAIFQ